ncbi:RNA polymerase sigma factor [Kitasatospora griseola]|uniref:RNA polymerase sigma factor n=1 Tax=Kitasatospora griseola TaxID=2064 RepID=UPI003855FED4
MSCAAARPPGLDRRNRPGRRRSDRARGTRSWSRRCGRPSAGRSPGRTELCRSHHPGLLRYAGILTGGDHWRAEDLVAEAHLRVGGGWPPGSGSRTRAPTWPTTVRRPAAAPVRERAVPDVPGGESGDPAAGVAETDRMRRLVAQLPERWAHALWRAEVEGLPPGGIGARLGGGGAAVLVHRAREGLRPAHLRAYPGSPHHPSCAGHWATPAGHAGGRAGRRAGQRVERHLPHCADCRRPPALLRQADPGPAGLAGGVLALPAALLGPPAGVAGQRGGEPGSPCSPAPASRPASRAPRRTRTPSRRCSR